jgi:hypothetical protein
MLSLVFYCLYKLNFIILIFVKKLLKLITSIVSCITYSYNAEIKFTKGEI